MICIEYALCTRHGAQCCTCTISFILHNCPHSSCYHDAHFREEETGTEWKWPAQVLVAITDIANTHTLAGLSPSSVSSLLSSCSTLAMFSLSLLCARHCVKWSSYVHDPSLRSSLLSHFSDEESKAEATCSGFKTWSCPTPCFPYSFHLITQEKWV